MLNSRLILQRCTAAEALDSSYFREAPAPTPRELFPSWPARSEGNFRAHSTVIYTLSLICCVIILVNLLVGNFLAPSIRTLISWQRSPKAPNGGIVIPDDEDSVVVAGPEFKIRF